MLLLSSLPTARFRHTGGTGTMLFTVGGMGILAAAGAVMVVPRKFRKKEEC